MTTMTMDFTTNNINIGKLKLSEALVFLRPIAKAYNLNLSKVSDFKTARLILANLYFHDVQYEH